MSSIPKYHRVILEVEVEVVDEIQARATTVSTLHDPQTGETEIFSDAGTTMLIPGIVGQAIAEALRDRLPAQGLRYVSSGALPRTVVDDIHPEITLPAMPHRGDDGQIDPGFFGTDG